MPPREAKLRSNKHCEMLISKHKWIYTVVNLKRLILQDIRQKICFIGRLLLKSWWCQKCYMTEPFFEITQHKRIHMHAYKCSNSAGSALLTAEVMSLAQSIFCTRNTVLMCVTEARHQGRKWPGQKSYRYFLWWGFTDRLFKIKVRRGFIFDFLPSVHSFIFLFLPTSFFLLVLIHTERSH